jgi:hypothetical protein
MPRAAFAVLEAQIAPGEIEHVKGMLAARPRSYGRRGHEVGTLS